MGLDVALLAIALVAGLALQRLAPGDGLRRRAWLLYFWTVTPLVVFHAFSRVPLDREIGLALAAAVLGAWTVVGLAFLYARSVSRARDEQGALVLGAGFPNTGFLGYPLAQLAFGADGLALAVLFDRLSYVVPVTAVTNTIARLHGREGRPTTWRARLRVAATNPPLWAAAVAVALRLADVDPGGGMDAAGDAAAHAVGPAGFLLLGLALPLDRPSHSRGEVARAGGALVIRFAAAPLLLLAYGAALGVDVPGAFVLASALPCAFHILILARVYDLRPALVRLLVVASTVPAVVAVVSGVALLR
ncbi:MAG: AEC family transporter [Thermoleophilia bacterium]